MNIIEKIKAKKVPQHIALIMDGNGRWAKKQGMGRVFGHKNALTAIRETVSAAADIGVKAITLYAFSTENWNRPKLEVDTLMNLIINSLKKELPEFQKNSIKVKAIGRLTDLPSKAQETLKEVIEATQYNTTLTLTFALSYGGREEITTAVKSIAQLIQNQKIEVNQINEQLIQEHLYTHFLPDVDLVIRTSGEQRVSNYLLWQIAYAELHFTNVLWPDFRREDLFKAVDEFQNRERRFGKISEQLK